MATKTELIEGKKEKVLELYEEIDTLEDLLEDEKDEAKITNINLKIEILTKKQEKLLNEIRNLNPKKND